MSQNKNKPKKVLRHHKKKQPWPIILLIGGALLLLFAVVYATKKPSGPKVAVEVAGSPRLKVDKEKVDLGDIKLGQTVEVSFQLSNVGDQVLRFSKAPYVEVLEGCWPPTPAIGSMALKPGESTTLKMQFMMHTGMDGMHDFEVHLPSNDNNWGDKTLTVLSNWMP